MLLSVRNSESHFRQRREASSNVNDASTLPFRMTEDFEELDWLRSGWSSPENTLLECASPLALQATGSPQRVQDPPPHPIVSSEAAKRLPAAFKRVDIEIEVIDNRK